MKKLSLIIKNIYMSRLGISIDYYGANNIQFPSKNTSNL